MNIDDQLEVLRHLDAGGTEMLDPSQIAMNKHLRLISSLSDETQYTEEQRAKLDKAIDISVAGYVAEQMRERRKRKTK